mmetsp:Transcript_30465/g.87376  ORF Transcript_30465/g.87376 Transcript_30465/m.87376 type:complete len:269 (-) Transcript_30465:647-1453(-)
MLPALQSESLVFREAPVAADEVGDGALPRGAEGVPALCVRRLVEHRPHLVGVHLVHELLRAPPVVSLGGVGGANVDNTLRPLPLQVLDGRSADLCTPAILLRFPLVPLVLHLGRHGRREQVYAKPALAVADVADGVLCMELVLLILLTEAVDPHGPRLVAVEDHRRVVEVAGAPLLRREASVLRIVARVVVAGAGEVGVDAVARGSERHVLNVGGLEQHLTAAVGKGVVHKSLNPPPDARPPPNSDDAVHEAFLGLLNVLLRDALTLC